MVSIAFGESRRAPTAPPERFDITRGSAGQLALGYWSESTDGRSQLRGG
jgi:hypothetical protein